MEAAAAEEEEEEAVRHKRDLESLLRQTKNVGFAFMCSWRNKY